MAICLAAHATLSRFFPRLTLGVVAEGDAPITADHGGDIDELARLVDLHEQAVGVMSGFVDSEGVYDPPDLTTEQGRASLWATINEDLPGISRDHAEAVRFIVVADLEGRLPRFIDKARVLGISPGIADHVQAHFAARWDLTNKVSTWSYPEIRTGEPGRPAEFVYTCLRHYQYNRRTLEREQQDGRFLSPSVTWDYIERKRRDAIGDKVFSDCEEEGYEIDTARECYPDATEEEVAQAEEDIEADRNGRTHDALIDLVNGCDAEVGVDSAKLNNLLRERVDLWAAEHVTEIDRLTKSGHVTYEQVVACYAGCVYGAFRKGIEDLVDEFEVYE